MNPIMAFLRNLDKRRLVYILRRIVSLWIPMKPYAACRSAARCPCPLAHPAHVTGVAIGAHQACVNLK